jgi:hypothetical protein
MLIGGIAFLTLLLSSGCAGIIPVPAKRNPLINPNYVYERTREYAEKSSGQAL